MKTITQMLRNLERPDVSEFAIASGRLPCIKVEGVYQPIDDAAPSTEAILRMLMDAGGGRYLDALTEKPVHWSIRLEGIGSIAVTAALRDEKVQARFIVTRRDATPVEREPPPPQRGTLVPPSPQLGSPPATVPGTGIEPEPSRAAPPAPSLTAPAAPPIIVPAPTPLFSSGPPSAGAASLPGTSASMSAAPQIIVPAPSVAMPATSSIPPPPSQAPPPAASSLAVSAPAAAPPKASPISEALESALSMARAARASDLHIIAERPLLLRVAGDLTPRGDVLSAAVVETILLPQVPERARAVLDKDGACDFSLEHTRHGRFRVNVSRQRTGYKGSFRLLSKEIPTLASLGLPEEIGRAVQHHQGLILITGPSGHGKTSTLAAIVDILNRETTRHVITIEDPVEHVHPRKRAMMSQREVGVHTLSFKNALKAALREDPDVIVVGELRDAETVRMALSASETGHLVLGTMSTPSAARTVDRLIDLFPPSDQAQVRLTLAGGLRLIVSQRLLPGADGAGMVAAAELLPGSVPLWSLIRDNKTFQIPSLQQRGKAAGVVRLDDSLADLVRAGKVTREAAYAVAESPEELEATLTGKRTMVAPAPSKPPEGLKQPPETKRQELSTTLLQKAGSFFVKKGD